MLCKKKRRLHILLRWHCSKCTEGDDFETVVANFFKIILYTPLKIALFTTHIQLFQISTQLIIPYSWLNPHEKSLLQEVMINRKEYFGNIQNFVNDGFLMKDYKKPIDWSIQHRREILRDFVLFCYSKKDIHSTYLFLSVCQKLMLNAKNVDRFVLELHNAIQTGYPISNILCVY